MYQSWDHPYITSAHISDPPSTSSKITIYLTPPTQSLLMYSPYFTSSTSLPNATLTSCPFIFTHFWVDATAKQQQTHPKVSENKWATGQSCIR